MESWPHLPVLNTMSTTRRLGGISGNQSQARTAFLWPTYGRQLHDSYKPQSVLKS